MPYYPYSLMSRRVQSEVKLLGDRWHGAISEGGGEMKKHIGFNKGLQRRIGCEKLRARARC